MNSEELKQLQAPLKNQYREDPNSAVVTLKAQSRLGEGITCKIETGKAMVTAGLHPATGGNGFAACSGEMLLEALAACAGVTLNSVATAIGVELADASVQVEGDLDFRGTLGVSKEAPVGFAAIRMNFKLESKADKALLDKLIELTERYCVVYQTLKAAPNIDVNYEIA